MKSNVGLLPPTCFAKYFQSPPLGGMLWSAGTPALMALAAARACTPISTTVGLLRRQLDETERAARSARGRLSLRAALRRKRFATRSAQFARIAEEAGCHTRKLGDQILQSRQIGQARIQLEIALQKRIETGRGSR